MPVPLRYFCGYPDDVDFSKLEAVYLDNPLIVGTNDLASKKLCNILDLLMRMPPKLSGKTGEVEHRFR